MLVLKFGGSSLKSAANVRKCIRIAKREKNRKPLVVVSAHGGMTDRLIDMAGTAVAGKVNLDDFRVFHAVLADSLRLNRTMLSPLLESLDTILRGVSLVRELTPKTMDHILSFGERLSALIVAAAMNTQGLKAQAVNSYEIGFVTDSNFGQAAPLDGIESDLAANLSKIDAIPVITGFIGRDPDGNITTIGRNGSDYTAAIIGAAVDAEEVQIWSDVDGVLTADPSLISDAAHLPVMSFAEAGELAYYGAEVLHVGTLIPAVKKNIPIRVANTLKPDQPGTLIVNQTVVTDRIAKSVVYKENVSLINVVSPRLMSASQLLSSALEILNRHRIGIHIAATSVAGVSLVTDNSYTTARLDGAASDLKRFWSVGLERDKAIICVVGEEIKGRTEVLGNIFTALAKAGIKARMVSHSASEINVAFLVENDQIEPAVRAVHALLVGA